MKHILSAVFVLLLVNSASAQDEGRLRVLEVIGSAGVTYPATHVQVQLGIQTPEMSSAREAQAEAARVSDGLVKYLKSQKVEGLNTSALRLHPSYKNADDRGQPDLYRAENIVRFRTIPSKVGNMLDRAIALGATRIDQTSPYAPDENRKIAKQEAIELATKNAVDQANSSLKVFGAKIQNIALIKVDPVFDTRAPVALRAMANSPLAATSAFAVGDLSVSARVLVRVLF